MEGMTAVVCCRIFPLLLYSVLQWISKNGKCGRVLLAETPALFGFLEPYGMNYARREGRKGLASFLGTFIVHDLLVLV